MNIDEEKEARLSAILCLNDEILEATIQEFEDYIKRMKDELERRRNKK